MTVEWILTPERIAAATALVAAYVGLCWTIRSKVRTQHAAELLESSAPQGDADAPSILVIYASQTGQAEALARSATATLVQRGLQVRLMPVEKLTQHLLAEHQHSLWLLSTTGEGDAPDHALGFVQSLMASQVTLPHHQSLVLALGDHEYQQFCAFGMRTHEWLQNCGARSELVCVDNMDAQNLQAWQAKVELMVQSLTGTESAASQDWLPAHRGTPMVLQQRRLLNPGSPGRPLYQLDWVAASGKPEDLPPWQSGDLVSLCVPADPTRARDYSIASIPSEGCLQLLVRQSLRADGRPGLASDWLCQGMAIGDELALNVREHSGFRLGENAARPLILIGNGSGLAGLLSHLKTRIAQGRGDQWLLFGERSPHQDALYAQQLQQWLDGGQLARLDRAWSRNIAEPHYVQDLLHRQADEVQRWVAQGAAIYVCGSLQGMGQGVHLALQTILGEAQLVALQQNGRYRRDVY